jgi:predicted nucleic acid-binding protein
VLVYLDTSALVKLYSVERGRTTVERAVEEARRLVTSAVAYPEARSAFARKARERLFSSAQLREAVRALDDDWSTLEVVATTERLGRFAGDLADTHALRGLDAVHLASALFVQEAASGRGGDPREVDDVRFLSFDPTLDRAAAKLLSLYR